MPDISSEKLTENIFISSTSNKHMLPKWPRWLDNEPVFLQHLRGSISPLSSGAMENRIVIENALAPNVKCRTGF